MKTQTARMIAKTSAAVIDGGLRRATAYLAADLTVKATAQRRPDKRNRTVTLLVTVGRPNFAERRFLRLCQQAGEPLPVRKIQLKFWPKK